MILAAIIALFAFTAKAQSNTEEITLIQSVYGMEKRDLIAKHMKLEASQSDFFWQMYDEYEITRKEIGMKRARNIEEYAKKYENLSNFDADAIMKTTFEVNNEFIKLWDKTYNKMAKSLSSVTAAQFIQAEIFLETMVRQELAMQIPLIGEFETK